LVCPFFNEKAKSILGKLSPEVVGDYARLKAAVLQEFKLSANVYLERFNTCRRDSDETYVAFSSKLKGLLGYYLDSRRVTTFEKLSELLVCDRIKSALSEGCLRYVLSIESATTNGWLPLRELTEAIDRYLAAHTGTNDKPKAFAVGQALAPRPSGFSIPPPRPPVPRPAVPRANVGTTFVGRGGGHQVVPNSATLLWMWGS